jgi:hypothetical protein
VTCIGEPISWLRLERYAQGTRDPAIGEHLAACPACARCLAEIEHPEHPIELPRLVIPVAPARRRWRWWLAPALAAAAAVAVLVIVRPAPDSSLEHVARVKGVGDVVIGMMRERAGAIRDDVLTYAPGDRFKVVVTCPPAASAWVDVAVEDAGEIDYPLAPTQLACGNRVAVPGAFTITGDRPNRVCVRVAAGSPPPRTAPRPGEPDVACLVLRPE